MISRDIAIIFPYYNQSNLDFLTFEIYEKCLKL